jgi:hypothetical protein
VNNIRRSPLLALAKALAIAATAAPLAGCAITTSPPAEAPRDASLGLAPPAFNAALACQDWRLAAGPDDDAATSHVSFPELSPSGCFVQVRHDGDRIQADPTPPGCGYPGGTASIERLRAEADRYERIASGASLASPPALPLDLACPLPAEARAAAARVNARTLRALARRLARGRTYPYAAVSTFGFGRGAQGETRLVPWRPGDACPSLDKADMDRLDVNVVRAGRAAAAHLAGVAPVVTVSGGAVHSPLYEAFALDYLLTCRFGVREDAVLLDPCADHTHTNIRNTGGLVIALGGRRAYIVTDDGLQGSYLQDWNAFHLIGGSIDQRSLRDFGYLLGSFRKASVGIEAGFWFTPYRFWASPDPGLGSFSCVR